VGIRIVGLEPDGLVKARHGRVELVLLAQDDPQAEVGLERAGLEADGPYPGGASSAFDAHGTAPGRRSVVRVEHVSPGAGTDRTTGLEVRGARDDHSRGRDFDRRRRTARDRPGWPTAPSCFSGSGRPMADGAVSTRYHQCDGSAPNPSIVKGFFCDRRFRPDP
jgi:hypothetical protein